MKKIKHIIISLLSVLAISTSVVTVTPSVTMAAPNGLTGCVGGSVLTFPCWYKGLTLNAQNVPQVTKLTDIWKIVLNVVEMFIQLIGYFAVGYVLWGGFKYIKSQGNPQNIASAKSTIMNAAIGLGIALSSVAIVNFVSSRF